jgi:hypothetical protein
MVWGVPMILGKKTKFSSANTNIIPRQDHFDFFLCDYYTISNQKAKEGDFLKMV